TPQMEVLHKLQELRHSFFAYVVTFLLAGIFWFLHHLTFHFIRYVNRALCWLNLLFLLFVSLLPFSTAMLSRFMGKPVGLIFYFGNQLLVSLFLFFQWTYARRRHLVQAETDTDSLNQLTLHISLFPIGCVLSIVLSLVA